MTKIIATNDEQNLIITFNCEDNKINGWGFMSSMEDLTLRPEIAEAKEELEMEAEEIENVHMINSNEPPVMMNTNPMTKPRQDFSEGGYSNPNTFESQQQFYYPQSKSPIYQHPIHPQFQDSSNIDFNISQSTHPSPAPPQFNTSPNPLRNNVTFLNEDEVIKTVDTNSLVNHDNYTYS